MVNCPLCWVVFQGALCGRECHWSSASRDQPAAQVLDFGMQNATHSGVYYVSWTIYILYFFVYIYIYMYIYIAFIHIHQNIGYHWAKPDLEVRIWAHLGTFHPQLSFWDWPVRSLKTNLLASWETQHLRVIIRSQPTIQSCWFCQDGLSNCKQDQHVLTQTIFRNTKTWWLKHKPMFILTFHLDFFVETERLKTKTAHSCSLSALGSSGSSLTSQLRTKVFVNCLFTTLGSC